MEEIVVNPSDPGSLLPAKVRTIVYVLTIMLGAAYAVVEANVNLHWGFVAAYAAWNAGVGILAVANVPPAARRA
jgi:hypothetical protein